MMLFWSSIIRTTWIRRIDHKLSKSSTGKQPVVKGRELCNNLDNKILDTITLASQWVRVETMVLNSHKGSTPLGSMPNTRTLITCSSNRISIKYLNNISSRCHRGMFSQACRETLSLKVP
jgi:hypothetical protein